MLVSLIVETKEPCSPSPLRVPTQPLAQQLSSSCESVYEARVYIRVRPSPNYYLQPRVRTQ
jgi:hypothetical protein